MNLQKTSSTNLPTYQPQFRQNQNLRQTNLKFELCAIAPILALGYGRSCCPELSVRLVKVIGPSAARARASALRARRASMHSSEMLGLTFFGGFWAVGWMIFFWVLGSCGGDLIDLFKGILMDIIMEEGEGACWWLDIDHAMIILWHLEHDQNMSKQQTLAELGVVSTLILSNIWKVYKVSKIRTCRRLVFKQGMPACHELYLFALRISDSLDPSGTGPQSLGPEAIDIIEKFI